MVLSYSFILERGMNGILWKACLRRAMYDTIKEKSCYVGDKTNEK